MDINVVQNILNELKDSLGDGFMATDIWEKNAALSIAGINTQPKATALFNRVTEMIGQSLTGSEGLFQTNLETAILKLENGLYIYLVELNSDFRWGMLVDGKKVQLGIMLSISLPSAIKKLRNALRLDDLEEV
jgi:hypothetical protein